MGSSLHFILFPISSNHQVSKDISAWSWKFLGWSCLRIFRIINFPVLYMRLSKSIQMSFLNSYAFLRISNVKVWDKVILAGWGWVYTNLTSIRTFWKLTLISSNHRSWKPWANSETSWSFWPSGWQIITHKIIKTGPNGREPWAFGSTKTVFLFWSWIVHLVILCDIPSQTRGLHNRGHLIKLKNN